MDRLIYRVLIAGVAASSLMLTLGLLLFFSGAKNTGMLIIELGIFVLFATPVLRVAMSVISFARDRNRLYTIITLVVLADVLFAIFVLPALLHIGH